MEKGIFRTSAKERWAFALFMTGQGVINVFVGSFLQLYLTDIGITAYAVGTMFLLARVWDAVNDPIFGAILDKLNLKSGKFIPFIRAGNIILPISVVLMFAIPSSIPLGWKLAWSYVSYMIFDIGYTICDVPIFAMTSAATDQVQERTNIMSRNTVMGTLAMIVVSIVVPILFPVAKPLGTAVILAIIAAFLMFFMSRFAKERYINKDENEVTLKNMFGYVKENKYLRICFLGIMTLGFTNMINAVMAYFAVNNLGSLTMMTVIMMMLIIPTVLVGAVMPKLVKRFDKFNLLIAGVIGQVVLGVISYFIGYDNLVLFFIILTIRFLFLGIQLVVQLQFTGDCVEYGEFVTGKRLQGTAYSLQTFVFKFMNAVPGALAMFILGAFGFVEGEGAIQPPSATNAIWALFTLSPAVGALIAMPIFSRYKLRDKTVQIMAAANSGEISREEAEAQLAGKF